MVVSNQEEILPLILGSFLFNWLILFSVLNMLSHIVGEDMKWIERITKNVIHGSQVMGLSCHFKFRIHRFLDTQMEQVPIKDGLNQVGNGLDLWMLMITLNGRSPTPVSFRIITAREKHNDVICSSMLHVANLSHKCVIPDHIALKAAVEVYMESARLVQALVWNVEEVVIRNKCFLFV